MDGGAWKPTVLGFARVGHDSATKLPVAWTQGPPDNPRLSEQPSWDWGSGLAVLFRACSLGHVRLCGPMSYSPGEGNGTHSRTLAWKIPGRRSLVGCGPWGPEESDTTERFHFHSSLSRTGEGKGTPLQCFCLENPRDGGAWCASICGVSQSQTTEVT